MMMSIYFWLATVFMTYFTCVRCIPSGHQCIENCSATSHKGHTAICSIQDAKCHGEDSPNGGVAKPIAGESTEWYLFSGNKQLEIGLNVSWKVNQDQSLESLNGYEISVFHWNEGTPQSFTPTIRKYYCLDTKLNVSHYGSLSFYYDCYRKSAKQNIQPSDSFLIYVTPFPKQIKNKHLDDTTLKMKVKVPSCKDRRLRQLIECQISLVEVLNYFCDNRTFALHYNLASAHGNSANVMLCYQKSPTNPKCQYDLTSSQNQSPYGLMYVEIPLSHENLFDNFSVEVWGDEAQDNGIPRERRKINFPVDCSSITTASFPVVLAPILCVIVIIGFITLVLCFRKRDWLRRCIGHKPPHFQDYPVDVSLHTVSETPDTSCSVTVYVIFVNDHPKHQEIVLKFTNYLQSELGFNVIFELWEQQEVFKDCSSWLENAIKQAEKIVVIWSPGAKSRWEQQNTPSVCQNDLFTPVVNWMKEDLFYKRNMGKYFSAYFEYCSKADIPQVFCDQSFCQFKLMEQFEELYFRLQNVEKFQPGFELKQNKVVFNKDINPKFNALGQSLKSSISDMCTFVKSSPDWFKTCINDIAVVNLSSEARQLANTTLPLAVAEIPQITDVQLHLPNGHSAPATSKNLFTIKQSIEVDIRSDNSESGQSVEIGHEFNTISDIVSREAEFQTSQSEFSNFSVEIGHECNTISDIVSREAEFQTPQSYGSPPQSVVERIEPGFFDFDQPSVPDNFPKEDDNTELPTKEEREKKKSLPNDHTPQSDTDEEREMSQKLLASGAKPYSGGADSGISTYNGNGADPPALLASTCTASIQPSVFGFNSIEISPPQSIEPSSESVQLADIDLDNDPWQSLAMLNSENV